MKAATKTVRAGHGSNIAQGAPIAGGPVFASTYHLRGDPDGSTPYIYGRFANPTWTAFETALSELEGGPSLVFPSGMAAVSAVLACALRPGQTLLVPQDCYYTTRLVASGYFTEHGVKVVMAATNTEAMISALKANPGVRLVWLETPSNPLLDVCDVAKICQAAHATDALVAVDNTTVTMLGQQPLALGADFSVASDTKALSGHSDVLLGHVAVQNPDLLLKLQTWRTQSGAIAGPMEVWLAHRSLATLHLRLGAMCHNALALAAFLEQQLGAGHVRYPGLTSDPSHALAKQQMQFYGPVLGFDLKTQAAAEGFLKASKLVIEATSFGSVHSSAERRARWGGDAISPGYVRLSAGIEAPEDLLEDMSQALQAVL